AISAASSQLRGEPWACASPAETTRAKKVPATSDKADAAAADERARINLTPFRAPLTPLNHMGQPCLTHGKIRGTAQLLRGYGFVAGMGLTPNGDDRRQPWLARYHPTRLLRRQTPSGKVNRLRAGNDLRAGSAPLAPACADGAGACAGCAGRYDRAGPAGASPRAGRRGPTAARARPSRGPARAPAGS